MNLQKTKGPKKHNRPYHVKYCHFFGSGFILPSDWQILAFCPGNLPHSSIPTTFFHPYHIPLNSPISTHSPRHTTYLRPLKELRRSCIGHLYFRAAKPHIYVARQSHKIAPHPGRWGRGLPGPGLWGLYRSCEGAASAGHKNSRYK